MVIGTLLLAVVALPLLLYLPGMLVSRVLGLGADVIECHYERVVISVLLSGWLALVLASSGVFSLWLLLAMLALVCVGLWRVENQWTTKNERPTTNGGRRWATGSEERTTNDQRPTTNDGTLTAELIAFAVVGLIALLLMIRPFEVVLGARDAGVYANAGFAIARTGSLVQYDPLLAELGEQSRSGDPDVRGPAEQALSNFLGVQHPERFIATRLYTAGFMINEGDMFEGRIVPQGLHLLPVWIALLTSVLGMYGGLFAPGLMGILGAWSVGMLGRRLAGPWVGLLAFLLLALNSVQVWFARYSTSETTAQFLTFAGLYFFARCQARDEQPATNNQRRTDNTGQWSLIGYAALAGIAIGQLVLTRIDGLLVASLMLLYLVYCAVSHRWRREQTALALGLGAMLLHAGLHIIFIARSYFFDTAFARLQDYAITAYLAQPFITPLLREVYHTTNRSPFKDPWRIWRELAALASAVAVLLAVWCWPQPLRFVEALIWRWQRVLVGAISVGILLLATYAYFIRPQILSPALLAQMSGCLQPQQWQVAETTAAPRLPETTQQLSLTMATGATSTVPITIAQDTAPALSQPEACLKLQGYVGAPIAIPPPPPGVDAKRMIPLANFVRMGWYLSPLGIVLGIAGFALWWWQGTNRNAWLFLVVGLLGTFLFVRDAYGTSDQSYIYILRRFVPVAYPAFSLSIAYALVALMRRGEGKGIMHRFALLPFRLSASALLLLLVAFFVWTGRPIYAHVEYAGVVGQLEQFARRFAPSDVLLLRGGAPTYSQARDVPDLIATPLRFGFGLNVLPVKSSNPGNYAQALAAQVRSWQAAGRAVYLVLGASGGNFALPGFTLQPAGDMMLTLPEFEQLTDQKPRNVATLRLSFAVYRLVEGPPEQIAALDPPLSATDFANQVRGFYLPERDLDAQEATTEGSIYAWTDGDALLRLPWSAEQTPAELELRVAGGPRPSHLGAARLCLSIQPEQGPWPVTNETFVPLGCLTLGDRLATYRVVLDPAKLPSSSPGSALLRLESTAWIPAQEDASQHDQRSIGIQFVEVSVVKSP